MNTKLHAVSDADGRPLSFFMTAGHRSWPLLRCGGRRNPRGRDRALLRRLVGFLPFTHLTDASRCLSRALGIKFDQRQQHCQALVKVVHVMLHDLDLCRMLRTLLDVRLSCGRVGSP
jgi:hypothetical protein